MPLTISQKIDEAWDQLDNLESMRYLFDQGRFAIYKNIAVSLRFLLTGSSGQPGLISDVLPTPAFFPLRTKPTAANRLPFLLLPAEITIKRGQASVRLGPGASVRDLDVAGGALGAITVGEMFDIAAAPIPLASWLQQPCLRGEWPLRTLISTVANKDGGAHLDTNEQLRAMKRWGHFHWYLIAGIAKSVYPQIRTQLLTAFPTHVREVR